MTINENFVDEKSAAVSGSCSFTEVVDEACSKLKDRQIDYSIRRILAMEDRLSNMEKELDAFLNNREN